MYVGKNISTKPRSDRKKVTVDDGTSKGFGRKGVDPYGFNYLNSVYWDGAD